jgi:YD repeat-containing protein
MTSTSLNPNFESFGYDNNGNQTSRRTRSGAQFALVYDAMNRLLRETGPNRRETFGYDASSLRTCAEVWPAASGTTTCGSGSPTHRITAAFDLALRLSSESARRAGTTRTVSYQYDANGNRSRVTWPDGWYAAYGFDAFNQLTAVDDSAGVALWRQSWRRDARLGQILRTGTAWNSGTNPAEGLTDLSYEADGDLSLMSHRFLAQGAGTQFNFTYGYNLASQLVSEAANQPNWQWAGAVADTVPYAAANALDQYPSVDGLALTHDTNGNRTGYAGLTTTHDAENRLTAASKAGMSVTYLYDADGRRVWKDFSSGGSDTDFLSAGQMEIAGYDSTGKLLRRYVPGIALNERLAMINCGAGPGPAQPRRRSATRPTARARSSRWWIARAPSPIAISTPLTGSRSRSRAAPIRSATPASASIPRPGSTTTTHATTTRSRGGSWRPIRWGMRMT